MQVNPQDITYAEEYGVHKADTYQGDRSMVKNMAKG